MSPLSSCLLRLSNIKIFMNESPPGGFLWAQLCQEVGSVCLSILPFPTACQKWIPQVWFTKQLQHPRLHLQSPGVEGWLPAIWVFFPSYYVLKWSEILIHGRFCTGDFWSGWEQRFHRGPPNLMRPYPLSVGNGLTTSPWKSFIWNLG